MTGQHHSEYVAATGALTGTTLWCEAADLAVMLRPGYAAVPGVHDHLSRRVDLQTGAVVAWQPPAPADDAWQTWSWDAATERWIAAPTLAALQRDRIVPVLAAILALENRQARPLRELYAAVAAGQPVPAEAAQRLAQIDAGIVALRAVRAAMLAATTAAELAAVDYPPTPT